MTRTDRRYVRAAGSRIEPLGAGWVAYSDLSGESHLLNDETVAVMECLDEHRARGTSEVAAELAAVVALEPALVAERLAAAWELLLSAGMIRPASGPAT